MKLFYSKMNVNIFDKEVDVQFTPFQLSAAGMLAVLQGDCPLNNLNDITVDNDVLIPIKRSIYAYEVQSSEVNATQKSCSVQLGKSDGFKWGTVFLEYKIPKHYARKSYDQMAYDTLPGINCLEAIHISYCNTPLETLTPQLIIKRLLEYYGYELFMEYAEKWWGGVKTDTYCSKNQELHGILNNHFNLENSEKNVILEELQIILPLPASILMDNEKFCYLNAINSPLDLNIIFRDSEQFIIHTPDCILTKMSTKVSVKIETLCPNEVSHFFNNLPYINPELDYYFKNSYFALNENKLNSNLGDFKIPINFGITNKMDIYVKDSLFDFNQFFGSTVTEATSNWLASMFNPFETTSSSENIINLYTGCFVKNGERRPDMPYLPKINGSLCITNYTSNSITLKWNKTTTIHYNLVITCDTKWKEIGNFFFNLNTYSHLLPCTFVNPQLFHLKSFNLKIEPWEHSEHLENYADIKTPYQTSHILANGYYTLGYDSVSNRNKLAFRGVNNVVKLVNTETWAYLISQKVPSNNSAMELVAKKFPNVVKNNFQYYDLDSINRIMIESVTWQKGSCNYDQEDPTKIKFYRNFNSKENYFRSQLEIDYSYKDFKKNLDSKGFVDYKLLDVTGLKVKLKPIDIIYDGTAITDMLKDRASTAVCDLQFVNVQSCVRIMKYTANNKRITALDNVNKAYINQTLLQKIFLKNKFHKEVEKIPVPKPVFNTRNTYDDSGNSVVRNYSYLPAIENNVSYVNPSEFHLNRKRKCD